MNYGRYGLNQNKFLLEPEVRHLQLVLLNNREKDFRNCLMLQVALETGARAKELLSLTKSDINPYDRTIFIKGIKGSNDRELPLAPSLFFRLERHLKAQDSNLIFPIGYHRLRQIWAFYRPCQKPFHSLRHTFAIRLYMRTRDIRLVQVALGHRSIVNTMIYADYIYSKNELKRIIGDSF